MKRLLFLFALLIAGTANAQTYDWAFNLGGTAADNRAYSIAIDTAGNGDVYVTGNFRFTVDFDPSGNTANLTAFGTRDIYVAKYDSAGNYKWAFGIGSWNIDYGYSIVADPTGSGDVYVTGSFNGTADFDPSGNTVNLTSNFGSDMFIAKYDANGNYLWAFNMGDNGYGITIDPTGENVYLTGCFTDTVDFDPSGNTANLISISGFDIFVAKYDSAGNYIWAFNVEGTPSWGNIGYSIVMDTVGGGSVYITGKFEDTGDFDPSGNIANLTSNGDEDIFVAKYDTAGNYIWAFSVGGTMSDDWGYDIATDPAGSGDVYITGTFRWTTDFDPSLNTAYLGPSGGQDAFVAKYDVNGNYQWAFALGGTNSGDGGFGIATDPAGSGDIYVTGYFSYTADFDPSANTANLTFHGGSDLFVARYNFAGNYMWAFNVGPQNMGAGGNDIALGPAGSEYMCIAGSFSWIADFDPSTDTAYFGFNGSWDSFVAKYNIMCQPPTATVSTDTSICIGDSATLVASVDTGYQVGVSYLWSPVNGLSDPTSASTAASPGSTTTYTAIISTGCSSDTAYVTVTVNPIFNINDAPLGICIGDSALIYGNYETVAGTYYDSLNTINGCDSIHFAVLVVDSLFASTDTISIVQGDSILLGGAYQTTAGIYYDTLIATNGCDSIVATTLIVTVGIAEQGNTNQITIYPNPTLGKFAVQGAAGEIQVLDLFGRTVLTTTKPEIDMRGYAKGVYFIKVGEVVKKLVLH